MGKIYEVFMQDEYNNCYFIGFYNELKNAVPDINSFLEPYDAKIETLEEYPSTFGECFDTEVFKETNGDDDPDSGWTGVMIRGFIFDADLLGQVICDDDDIAFQEE